MARPIKNNCDYFPHDAGMRNHKKVKAIRNTFKNGYAIWSMILEYLTESDGNVFPYSELEFELMSGDFGFSVTEIRDVVDYCIRIEMLFNKDGFIHSESLDDRLAPVYEKRGRAKELSKKQLRTNGKFTNNNTDEPVVSVTETPQSKVKEIKGNKSKLTLPDDSLTQVIDLISEIRSKYQPKTMKLVHTSSRLNMVNRCKKQFNQTWPGRDFYKACRMAFEYKAEKWWGTDQWQYFMPETLLTANKNFIKYIEEAMNNTQPVGKKEEVIKARLPQDYSPA